MVFDKWYLIKSISAVTNYNSSSCFYVEFYDGGGNYVHLEIFQRSRFQCTFKNTDSYYPFGFDDCHFYIYIKDSHNGVVRLKLNGTLKDFGPNKISQFAIEGWVAEEGHFAVKEYLKAEKNEFLSRFYIKDNKLCRCSVCVHPQ